MRSPRRGTGAVALAADVELEPPLDLWAAAECGGRVNVELAEGSMTDLLSSTLRMEVVATLPKGAKSRSDDDDSLDVLGFVDFALACVVRGPQPEYVLTSALLDEVGEPCEGGALLELTLAPDALLLDYLWGGVVLQTEAVDLTNCPPHWCPPMPDFASASAEANAAHEATQQALEAATAAEADAEAALAAAQSSNEVDNEEGPEAEEGGGASPEIAKLTKALEAAQAASQAAQAKAKQPVQLARLVADAVNTATAAAESSNLSPPSLVDVSQALGAQSFLLGAPAFVFATSGGFDLSLPEFTAAAKAAKEAQSRGASRGGGSRGGGSRGGGSREGGTRAPTGEEEEGGGEKGEGEDGDKAAGDGEGEGEAERPLTPAPVAEPEPEPEEISPGPEAEMAAQAAAGGRAGWRVRWGPSQPVWVCDASRRRLRAAVKAAAAALRAEAEEGAGAAAQADGEDEDDNGSLGSNLSGQDDDAAASESGSAAQGDDGGALASADSGMLRFELTVNAKLPKPAKKSAAKASAASIDDVGEPPYLGAGVVVAVELPLMELLGGPAAALGAIPSSSRPGTPAGSAVQMASIGSRPGTSSGVGGGGNALSIATGGGGSAASASSASAGGNNAIISSSAYGCQFVLGTRLTLTEPPPSVDLAATAAFKPTTNDDDNGEEEAEPVIEEMKDTDGEERGSPSTPKTGSVVDARTAFLTMTLSSSAPFVVPPPPPPPQPPKPKSPRKLRSRAATPSSRAQTANAAAAAVAVVLPPSPAAVFLALPPLVQLGATRRWPTSLLSNGLPQQRPGGGAFAGNPGGNSGAAAGGSVLEGESMANGSTVSAGGGGGESGSATVTGALAKRGAGGSQDEENTDDLTAYPGPNWRRVHAWSAPDPLVAALVPYRPIESPELQLVKRSPADDLEREVKHFANKLADEIRVQFQLDDRVWRDVQEVAAKKRREKEQKARAQARAGRAASGLADGVRNGPISAFENGTSAPASFAAPAKTPSMSLGLVAESAAESDEDSDLGDSNDNDDDDVSMTPSEEVRDGQARLSYHLSATGKYHNLAERLRQPIVQFAHFQLGAPLAASDAGTPAGDRYVGNVHRLVSKVTTQTLNALFRAAELYEDQPAARQDPKDALRQLREKCLAVGNLAEDSEAGGKLRQAEVRYRVRVAMVEVAADHGAPPLKPTAEERNAGVAFEAEPGNALLGDLATPLLVTCRLELAQFLVRNRLRSPPTIKHAHRWRGANVNASATAAAAVALQDDGGGLALQESPNNNNATAAAGPGNGSDFLGRQASFAEESALGSAEFRRGVNGAHPLSVPGLGLGDAAYGGLDGSVDLKRVRESLDHLGSDLRELRLLARLVTGPNGNNLPLRLRQDCLMLLGGCLLEHECSACPDLATWCDTTAEQPWSGLALPNSMPPYRLPGELDALEQELNRGNTGSRGLGAGAAMGAAQLPQPRRWSAVFLEHALRIALSPKGPAEGSEGFSPDELLACKPCHATLLAVLAVGLVATDARRAWPAGSNNGSSTGSASNRDGVNASYAAAGGADPLAWALGHEARARGLLRVAAEKRRREFSGELGRRCDEDDEVIVLLQAAEWFTEHAFIGSATIALSMVKQASNRASKVVRTLIDVAARDAVEASQQAAMAQQSKPSTEGGEGDEGGGDGDAGDAPADGNAVPDAVAATGEAAPAVEYTYGAPPPLPLMPRHVRVAVKMGVAQLALARVPVADADAAAAGRRSGSGNNDEDAAAAHHHLYHHLSEVSEARAAARSGLHFNHPSRAPIGQLLELAHLRCDDALAMFARPADAPVELLLLAADHAWATRMDLTVRAVAPISEDDDDDEDDTNGDGLGPKAAMKIKSGSSSDGHAAAVQRALLGVQSTYGLFLKHAAAQGAPVPLRAFTRMGAAVAELGQPEAAVDVYRQAASAWPQAASAWKGLGLALLQLKMFDDAEASLNLANERDSSDALVWGCLALCGLEAMLASHTTGNGYKMECAGACVREALGLGLDDIGLLFALAQAYGLCDRHKDEASVLRRALELREALDAHAALQGSRGAAMTVGLPTSETMRNSLGDSLRAQGYPLDALDVYQDVFESCLEKQEEELGEWSQGGDENNEENELNEAGDAAAKDEAKQEAEEEEEEENKSERTSGSRRSQRTADKGEGRKKSARSVSGSVASSVVDGNDDKDNASLASSAADAADAPQNIAPRPLRPPSESLVALVLELNRAALGMEALLSKLGRTAELKQMQYTVKMVNARLRAAEERATQQRDLAQ